MRDLLGQILLGHALHRRELLPQRLSLDKVLVHGARAIDGDLEPFLGCGFWWRRREGQRRGGGLGRWCRWGRGRALQQRAGACHVGHVCRRCGRRQGGRVGFGVVVVGGGLGVGFTLEREAQRRGIERLLRGFWGAVDGERDIVSRVVVFILELGLAELAALQRGEHTRRCLYVLISPKRCSTRKISRLSDRLAGRGTMRRCTEREGRCAAALRTDMAVVQSEGHEDCAAKPQKSASGSRLAKRITILGLRRHVRTRALGHQGNVHASWVEGWRRIVVQMLDLVHACTVCGGSFLRPRSQTPGSTRREHQYPRFHLQIQNPACFAVCISSNANAVAMLENQKEKEKLCRNRLRRLPPLLGLLGQTRPLTHADVLADTGAVVVAICCAI